MKRAVVILGMALIPLSTAAQDHGSAGSTPNTMKLAPGARSPAATIDDVAWLSGRWEGEFLGGVINGLSARKARIEGITPKPRAKVVDAFVPLSKMFGYSTDLRSLSQGRATFSMHFARFDRATEPPPGVFLG